MAVRIVIADQAEKQNQYARCFLQDRIVLGRSRSSDICLPDMAVSTRHGEIRLLGSDYAIVDLGSLNGTRVDGKALVPHRPRVLRNGNTIEIARFVLDFTIGADKLDTPREASVKQARELLAGILARAGNGRANPPAVLEIIAGPGRGSRFELPSDVSERFVIGRSREAHIRLPDGDVARFHVELNPSPEGFRVKDLGSRNGLFVEGELVEEAKLLPGEQFQIGQTVILLEHPAESTLKAIFSAPEEATSSFCLEEEVVDKPGEEEGTISGDPVAPEGEEEESPSSWQPVIGPADPLISENPVSPPTDSMAAACREGQRPGNDVVLIVVGALIVVISVLGLIYFFT